MAITQEYKDAVEKEDISMVRIMLKDSLVLDPTFSQFQEMLTLAQSKIEDLYDEHDGEELNYNKSSWTKDYMNEQLVNLVYNFSRERVDLIKKICEYTYKDRITKIKDSREHEKYKTKITKKEVGGALVVGGAVTATVGAVAAQPIIVAGGVTAVVVGGVIILTDK